MWPSLALAHCLIRITDTSMPSSTVDKLADYEDKLKRLSSGAALRALPTHPTTTTPDKSIQHAHRKSRSYLTVDLPDEPARPATADGVLSPPAQAQESRPSQFAKFPSFSNFWSGRKHVQQDEKADLPVLAQRQGEAQIILLDKSVDSSVSYPARNTKVMGAAEPSADVRPASKRSISAGSTTSKARSAGSMKAEHDFTTEHNLRLVAEQKLVSLQAELEDLSSTLFEQANKMVADERRLRAKVEAKAQKMEARYRETRDKLKELSTGREEARTMREERVMRLSVLEERVGKVERVRRVVQGVG